MKEVLCNRAERCRHTERCPHGVVHEEKESCPDGCRLEMGQECTPVKTGNGGSPPKINGSSMPPLVGIEFEQIAIRVIAIAAVDKMLFAIQRIALDAVNHVGKANYADRQAKATNWILCAVMDARTELYS